MGEIIFHEGFACNTDYGYGLPVIEGVTGDNAVSSVIGQYRLNSPYLAYENTGFVNKNTIHLDDTTVWNTSIEYSSGYKIHWTPSAIRSAADACWAAGKHYINLFCMAFRSENQVSYLLFTLKLNSWNASSNQYVCTLAKGWCNEPSPDADGAVYNSTLITTYYNRLNYREDIFLDVQLWADGDFIKLAPAGLHKNKQVAFLFTLAITSPFKNPDGGAPYTVSWPVNSSGNLSTSVSSINDTTTNYVLSLGACQSLGFGDPDEINSSPEVGPPSEEGGPGVDGDPSFDDSSDPIEIPANPSIGVSEAGFVRVYKTGSQSLQTLGVELFPPLQYTPPQPLPPSSSTTEAIVNGFDMLTTFFANVPSFFDQLMANALINYVIDCHVIPVTPSGGTDEYIKVGHKTLTSQGKRIYNDYVNVSCGSINIAEYYKNFADFITTAKLYLPFVGFVPVRPEWFQSDTLKVDYKFNVIDGSFNAYVRSGGKYVNNGNTGGTIVGQYAGNACIHLPITGVTYSNMAAGLVGAGAGMAIGAAAGNIPSAATSAIAAVSSHGDIAQSNAYNGSAAFLGCRYAFLTIERPVSSYAKNYQHEIGIPANIYGKLSQVSGFVRMERVHVDGISGATSEEKEEIRKLLASGVIV